MTLDGIDLSYLARIMLLWEQKRRELDELEDAIKDTVLQLGTTQTVGNVRATYNGGRRSYDYETPGRAANIEIIDRHTKQVIDWSSVCKDAGFDGLITSQSNPSVNIKLL